MQDVFFVHVSWFFFTSLGIYFLARIRRDIFFLLIISWRFFFVLLLPLPHHFSNGPSLNKI